MGSMKAMIEEYLERTEDRAHDERNRVLENRMREERTTEELLTALASLRGLNVRERAMARAR